MYIKDKYKFIFDPILKIKKEDIYFFESIQYDIHEYFKNIKNNSKNICNCDHHFNNKKGALERKFCSGNMHIIAKKINGWIIYIWTLFEIRGSGKINNMKRYVNIK